MTSGARPDLGPELDLLEGDPTPDFRLDQGVTIPRWVWAMAAALLITLSIPVYKRVRRARRIAAIRSGNIDAAWDEIVDRLRDLDGDISGAATPIEIASGYHKDLVPLATLYTASTYGGRPRGDGRSAFRRADERLSRRYSRWDKLVASVTVRSLRRR